MSYRKIVPWEEVLRLSCARYGVEVHDGPNVQKGALVGIDESTEHIVFIVRCVKTRKLGSEGWTDLDHEAVFIIPKTEEVLDIGNSRFFIIGEKRVITIFPQEKK